jgi:hypothetical protein
MQHRLELVSLPSYYPISDELESFSWTPDTYRSVVIIVTQRRRRSSCVLLWYIHRQRAYSPLSPNPLISLTHPPHIAHEPETQNIHSALRKHLKYPFRLQSAPCIVAPQRAPENFTAHANQAWQRHGSPTESPRKSETPRVAEPARPNHGISTSAMHHVVRTQVTTDREKRPVTATTASSLMCCGATIFGASLQRERGCAQEILRLGVRCGYGGWQGCWARLSRS